jgi:hypothetical protein
MMSWASIVAFIPEPQTLLIVVAPVASGSLALSSRQHATHEHLVDALGFELCAFERRRNHVGAELVGGKRRKLAHEASERRAGSGDDDDGVGSGGHGDSRMSG